MNLIDKITLMILYVVILLGIGLVAYTELNL